MQAAPAGRPEFHYFCFNAPHGASSFNGGAGARADGRMLNAGVQVPEAYSAPYRAQGLSDALSRYYGSVTCMDAAIGDLLATIKQRGEENDTLVIFTSDNGGSGNGGNAPLRGQKCTMREGGLSVPFIARWPLNFRREK